MDIVFIKELCIETVIGIYDWERKIKQFVCIDLELGTDISDAASYTMSSASNVTLYAKWTPNPHTITFNADGGSGANTNQAIEYNVSENLDSNPFTCNSETSSRPRD